MQTTLDCLPCFLRQALYTARIATDSVARHQEILARAAHLLPEFDLAVSPPENAIHLYRMIAELAGNPDPFAALKAESNHFALALRPELREQIRQAADPLATAVKFAIAGNVIDYGAHHQFDARGTIADCLAHPFAIDDYRQFRHDLAKARKILYLADNCGEIVFDGLLIEALGEKEVTVAVKERPIINDALLPDALACGLGELCTVVSNGTDCPGTPLDRCGVEFQQLFRAADLIISKGQGNFETLSEVSAPIYFLLTVKCPVVVTHVNQLAGGQANRRAALGDMVLLRSGWPGTVNG